MSGIVLTKPLIIASAVLCLGVGLVSYRTMDGANETVSNNMLTSANSGNDVANEYGKSSVYTENQGNSVEQQFWQLSDKLQGSEKSLSQLSERVSLIDREIERLKHVQSEAEVSPASLGGNEVANNSTADRIDMLLESQFASEIADPAWSHSAQQELTSAMQSLPGMLEMGNVSCVSTLCRFEGTYDSTENGRNGTLQNLHTLSWKGEVDVKSNANTGELVIYFAKPGHALPGYGNNGNPGITQ